MDWGTFSWPRFVELFPVYLGAFGAVALLGATFWQVKLAKREIAKRAAFDFFQEYYDNPLINQNVRDVYHLMLDVEDPSELIDDVHDSYTRLSVLEDLLNRYEVMSIGIINNGLDEGLAKEVISADFKNVWNYSEEYIRQMRDVRNNMDIYINIERLATQWNL